MFENLGMGELLIIMFVVLILFGGKKIPEIAKNLGKGISEFKKGVNDLKKEITITDDDLTKNETKKLSSK
jgi:sec-independent protein translocase protein TatA